MLLIVLHSNVFVLLEWSTMEMEAVMYAKFIIVIFVQHLICCNANNALHLIFWVLIIANVHAQLVKVLLKEDVQLVPFLIVFIAH